MCHPAEEWQQRAATHASLCSLSAEVDTACPSCVGSSTSALAPGLVRNTVGCIADDVGGKEYLEEVIHTHAVRIFQQGVPQPTLDELCEVSEDASWTMWQELQLILWLRIFFEG
eukprot:333144-Alexandrium_andersonii.AAC.1